MSHICTRWMRLLGGWTSGFNASLNGCAPGIQAKMLANEEAGLDSASLRDLRSATDLALSATIDPHGPTIAPSCLTVLIADKIKHFKNYFSAYHKHPALIQPVCTAFSTPCHMGRGLSSHPAPICPKTTALPGVLATIVRSENAQVLRAEVMNLLEKGAIEIVPPAQNESGFYSRYFLVPKKDGSLQPILDLRLLNYALMKRSFRMITLKQILPQICPGDWFMSLDLKDTYFHIQVAPYHRRFLRFANLPRAYCHPANGFRSWLQLSTADDSNCLSGASYDNSAQHDLLPGRYHLSAQSFP